MNSKKTTAGDAGHGIKINMIEAGKIVSQDHVGDGPDSVPIHMVGKHPADVINSNLTTAKKGDRTSRENKLKGR